MRTELTCMLIDNDEDDHEIFGLAMEELPGVHCQYFHSSPEALRSLEQTESVPQFIFIDMNMPRLNGIECVQAIRKLPHLQKAGIYLYSTHADPASVKLALQLGANGYLAKPAQFHLLVQELRSIFQSHTANYV